MIVALAGGVGGARLAQGLATILPPEQLCVVVNTGDDFEHLSLHISPDLDTVMYTLAGLSDQVQGWGIAGETWSFMEALSRLNGETWFRLGDRDLATHAERTMRIRRGESLSTITSHLCRQLGIVHRIVPMSDDPVRTIVHTASGPLAFQDYFVRQHAEPVLERVTFTGARESKMSPSAYAALSSPSLRAIVVCPSNPYLSIAPILSVPGMRTALEQRKVPVIAVSPIVAGRTIKGPAAKIMRELGVEASSLSVAQFYRGLIDALIIDRADTALSSAIHAIGIAPIVADTIMHDANARSVLARVVVEQASTLQTLPRGALLQ